MRIAAVSDLHGHLPVIPSCDLLIVAGDICPDFYDRRAGAFSWRHQVAWFDAEVRPWLASAPAARVILTWGNHDWCGEAWDFSAESSANGPDARPQILVDQSTTVGGLRVWVSPRSNQFGHWAFMHSPGELAALYATIPAGTDVIISHQPPYGYGDTPGDGPGHREHHGSHELLAAVERVRPRLVICGHIHGGHGRYQHDGVVILNVAVVNEAYEPVHGVTMVELE